LYRRFLQGRNFDPEGALVQFEEAMAIRKENQVIEAYDTISVEDFEQARKIVGLPISTVSYILTLSSTLTGLVSRQARSSHLHV
jgi:hypothetical protein